MNKSEHIGLRKERPRILDCFLAVFFPYLKCKLQDNCWYKTVWYVFFQIMGYSLQFNYPNTKLQKFMSFLDLFRQPVSIYKPYKCLLDRTLPMLYIDREVIVDEVSGDTISCCFCQRDNNLSLCVGTTMESIFIGASNTTLSCKRKLSAI